MIQRIQSIFLFLASACSFGLFGLPFANTEEAVANSEIFKDQAFNLFDDTAMLALFCVAGGLALIAIFLFKNRVLQSRFAQLVLLVTIAGIGWTAYIFSQEKIDAVNLDFGLALPLLTLVFTFLAFRNIKKDDKLVQSMDRLR